MTQDNYNSKIDWLFHQFPAFQKQGGMAYKPGLSHTISLLEVFNLDITKIKAVHIAGTNGKGSTCSFLASLLTESNQKVGLFTSPHLFDFRERIRVNGAMISKTELTQFIEEIQDLELAFKPSFFEITFILAVKHFIAQECDICVFETGMGGRLDATNVLSPIATAITNISLDHTEFLGDTLEAIAEEKGGIIKNNTPLFLGKKEAHSYSIFKEIAHSKNSTIFINEPRHTIEGLPEYQKENFNLAIQIVGFIKQTEIRRELISKALNQLEKNTGYGKRMELLERAPDMYLDVAHNDKGIQASIEFAKKKTKGRLHVILGSAKDKIYEEPTIEQLSSTEISFCIFSNKRSKTKTDWMEFNTQFKKEITIYPTIQDAILSVKHKLKEEDTLLITGSFFLISDYIPPF
ncbi:MAG: Mur ligase family protein [Crocinitomicaceae bacterium]